MEKKVKKLFIATGVLIATLVASIPLTSYADSQDSHTSSVSVTVSPVITLEVLVDNDDPSTEAKDINIEVTPNMVGTGKFTTKVSSNKAYSLTLNARNGKTDMTLDSDPNGTTPNKIPGTGNVTQGTTSWGVKLSSAQDYEAIPATATEFHHSNQPVADDTASFDIGISVASNLVAGKYSGTLVVTATNP